MLGLVKGDVADKVVTGVVDLEGEGREEEEQPGLKQREDTTAGLKVVGSKGIGGGH